MTQNDAVILAAVIASAPAWAGLWISYLSVRTTRRQTGELKDHIDRRLGGASDSADSGRSP